MNDVLCNENSIDLLMQHLGREFSMECLLSLIEFIQFEEYVYEHIQNDKKLEMDFSKESTMIRNNHKIYLPDSIPKSSIVFSNDDTNKSWIENAKHKCYLIFCKYINIESEYEINIAWRLRQKLIRILGNETNLISDESINEFILLNIFSRCGKEMINLMNGSFSRFKDTPNFQSLLLNNGL